ncbi:MAG: DUF4924 family protein [Bacteroidaceae bacterium]|nr:DUF4924 family protein [Bacteroidaceae bacterium]
MKIARQLRDTNIAEYLLYMWQLEDTLRAYGCDADRVRDEYVSRFELTADERQQEVQWLSDLCQMMREEDVVTHGHLQMNRGTLSLLTDLHLQLLQSPKHPFYSAAYYKALPFIVELRAKSGRTDQPELENCFEALYGVMLLRLQQKPLSKETQEAMTHISHLLALLADAWRKEKAGELEM